MKRVQRHRTEKPACARERSARPRLGRWLLALAVALGGASAPPVRAADSASLAVPETRVSPDDPAWRELAAQFARRADGTASFAERRVFPFRRTPVELQGESRVSAGRGLSLHYTVPEERIVVLDAQGVLVRDGRGDTVPPDDPRAAAANAALVQVLGFDLAALDRHFEIFGRRDAGSWTLAFVPRADELRRTIGTITVAGAGDALHQIEIRRSARQYVSIRIGPARATPFTAGELQRFFR